MTTRERYQVARMSEPTLTQEQFRARGELGTPTAGAGDGSHIDLATYDESGETDEQDPDSDIE